MLTLLLQAQGLLAGNCLLFDLDSRCFEARDLENCVIILNVSQNYQIAGLRPNKTKLNILIVFVLAQKDCIHFLARDDYFLVCVVALILQINFNELPPSF